MRKFSYITVGAILNELREEGAQITSVTYYRLEKRLSLPTGKKTSGKLQWRVYTRAEANKIKKLIKEEYNLVSIL